jgi:hypothetical protein
MSDVTPERVLWLWAGRLPLGKLVLLDGDPNIGKSTLTLDWSARVSTESPWPDETVPPVSGNVLLLSAEDGVADTIRPRLDAAGADLDRVHLLNRVEQRPPILPDDLDVIEGEVRSRGVVLVVIDPLSAFLSGRVDAYRDQDVRRALVHLTDLARAADTCVLVLRHLNKSSASNPLYRGGGSIAFVGAARVALLAALDPDDPSRRVVAVNKCNLRAAAPSLAYRIVSDDRHECGRVVYEGRTAHSAEDLLRLRGDDAGESAVGSAADDALAQILAYGPRWAAECVAEMRDAGFTKEQTRRARERIAETHKVGRPGDAEQGWKWAQRGVPCVESGAEGAEDGECVRAAAFSIFGDNAPRSEGRRE